MKRIFTLTAGRTGSAWLADFLSKNIACEVIQEPLGIEDFGYTMPDIKLMRTFNNYGNTDAIRYFWRQKLASITSDVYAETNHTLGKCGLIENLAISDFRECSSIIILKRDLVKQCCSYLQRGDFSNITIAWQWYLHPSYRRILVDPRPFEKLGSIAAPLWYCYEMYVRQEYYYRNYSKKISMIEVDLEQIVLPEGSEALLNSLGYDKSPVIPSPKNQGRLKESEELHNLIKSTIKKIKIDVDEILSRAIEKNFSFDV